MYRVLDRTARDVQFDDVSRVDVAGPEGSPIRVQVEREQAAFTGYGIRVDERARGIEPLDVRAVREQHRSVGENAQCEGIAGAGGEVRPKDVRAQIHCADGAAFLGE